jgi:hypothetical protein
VDIAALFTNVYTAIITVVRKKEAHGVSKFLVVIMTLLISNDINITCNKVSHLANKTPWLIATIKPNVEYAIHININLYGKGNFGGRFIFKAI